MADERGVAKNEKIMSKQNEAEISLKTHVKRPICDRCKRPQKVCLCEALPDKLLQVSTTVYILQHPEERHRTLTTVPLLSACLPNDKCIVYNDVHYSQEKYPHLQELLRCPQTLVLYPNENATDLREVVKEFGPSQKYNLVVPDGTWRQARKIFKRNRILQQARKVQLNENARSHYVIRTQPTRNSLSTLEAVAVALSILEGRDEITEVLRKPLQLLCDIQLQHGAVPHASKEEKREQEMLQQEQNRKEEEDEGKGMESLGQEKNVKLGQKNINDSTGRERENGKQNKTHEEAEDELNQKQNIQEHEHEVEKAPKRSKYDA